MKTKIEIPIILGLFYYPIVLLALSGIAYGLTLIGNTYTEWYVRLPLAIVSLGIQIATLAIAVYMLVLLGESVKKQGKKKK